MRTSAKRRVPKVIFVNRFYAPDQSATARLLTDLAEYLAATGHEVRVITSRLSYEGKRESWLLRQNQNGVHVVRLATTQFGRRNLGGRTLDYLSFYAGALAQVFVVARSGDRVVAKTDPPLLASVLLVPVWLRRARLINWVQDVFPEIAANLGFRVARGPSGWLMQRVRGLSLRYALKTVAIGPLMQERLQAAGARRVCCIPNWVDTESVLPIGPCINSLRQAWGLSDKFVVSYSGNLGRAHDVDTFLDAMLRLSARTDIIFVWIGGGHFMGWLQRRVGELGLRNCRFEPYQPFDSLSESLSVADVHLVTLKSSLEGLIVPSKFYGALAVGRPVIFVGERSGEIAGEIEAGACGAVVPEGDGEALVRAIERYADDPRELATAGANARRYVVAHRDRAISLRAWEAVVDE